MNVKLKGDGMAKSKTAKTNKAVIIVAVLAIIAAFGGLIYATFINPSEISVSESQSKIEVKKGQRFVITLTSNATTGFSWSVGDSYDKSVIKKIGNKYLAPNTDSVGAAGEEQWTFKGTEKGTTKLEFKYIRSWEGSSSQINQKTYEVTVK